VLVDQDAFEEKDVSLVFLAANIREAERAERALSDADVDYIVRPQKFIAGAVFGGEYDGVGMFVVAGQAPFCRRLLAAAGLAKGVMSGDESHEDQ
jgi:hypothetical protein